MSSACQSYFQFHFFQFQFYFSLQMFYHLVSISVIVYDQF